MHTYRFTFNSNVSFKIIKKMEIKDLGKVCCFDMEVFYQIWCILNIYIIGYYVTYDLCNLTLSIILFNIYLFIHFNMNICVILFNILNQLNAVLFIDIKYHQNFKKLW